MKTKKIKGTKSQCEIVQPEFTFHVKPIKCRSEKQKQFLKTIQNNTITLCSGPAGTSKTYTAVYAALKALEKKEVELIILLKPNLDVGGFELGLLPGSYEEKTDPYLYSYYDLIDQMVGEEVRQTLIAKKLIKIVPIALLRGRTFLNSFCLVDEVLNCNYEAFKTVITRIGEGSKYVLMGDTGLIDFKSKQSSPLLKIIELFKDDPEIGTFQFSEQDVVRHPIITHILEKLKILE